MDWCILVDENDNEIGKAEKMKVHEDGMLHRAFSVFILNDRGELLLQKRASVKYHSPGLWTNTCCSHPVPGETAVAAGERRLMEEMGFSVALQPAFSFLYRADVGDGLIEHEFDHVLVGRYNAIPEMNPEEVEDFRYVALDELLQEVERAPEQFTTWFRILLQQHLDQLKKAFAAL